MRILIIINNLGVGGAERLVIDDVNELVRRGIGVKLLTIKPEKEGKTLLGGLHNQGVHEAYCFGCFLNFKKWKGIINIIIRYNPDLLITHLWYANVIGRIAGKIAGVKAIISFEHNVYDNLKTWKMFIVDIVLQFLSSRIVAVSDAVKDSLIRHGIRNKNIITIINAIDVSKYEELKIKSRENDKLFTFIFVGRLINQKGVDILLKAFSYLKDSRLQIIGSGLEEEKLKNMTQDLGIASRVEFLGVRHDIPELLHNADCFVLPSRYEGLPMVLLEAVASQKIIIVSDFASAREIIVPHVNGIIVKKEDIGALADAMIEVSTNKILQQKLKEGVIEISKNVSIKKHIDKILNIV